jgi:prepilin-type N-terminal cleavage/methylation domain-containing protein
MIKKLSLQKGFSAVELLITLFIAAAFIATGYQLFTIIIKNGGDARTRAKASNIAYDNLRRYSTQGTNPCSTFTPSPSPSIPAGSGLSSASITVTVTCPYGTSSAVTKVLVSVKYGTPQQEVVHAMYSSN